MERTSISALKNSLSAVIDRVRAGETVLVLDRGTAVAKLTPAQDAPDDDRLARLERAGLVRRGSGKAVPLDRLAPPLDRRQRGAGVVEALLEERRESR